MTPNDKHYASLISAAWVALDEEHRVDDIGLYYTEDYVRHSPERDYDLTQFANTIRELIAGFPDLKFTLHDVISSENRVSYRWSSVGTHAGMYLNVPPTNRRVEVSGISMAVFRKDQMAEGWTVWNKVSALHRLGIIPLNWER